MSLLTQKTVYFDFFLNSSISRETDWAVLAFALKPQEVSPSICTASSKPGKLHSTQGKNVDVLSPYWVYITFTGRVDLQYPQVSELLQEQLCSLSAISEQHNKMLNWGHSDLVEAYVSYVMVCVVYFINVVYVSGPSWMLTWWRKGGSKFSSR